MAHEDTLEHLLDAYLPFQLNAEHQQGKSLTELAEFYEGSLAWVAERIASARLRIENDNATIGPLRNMAA